MGSIKLGIDTYIPEDSYMINYSLLFDEILTWIFFGEFLITSITYGFVIDDNSYLRDSWS